MPKKPAHLINTLPIPFPLFLGIIIVIFLGLRFLHLPESIGFGTDAGRDYLEVWNIVQNRDITLIGPPSQYSFEGRQFFFGPAPYYIMLPALVLGDWDPIATSYYLIILNALALLIALIILYTVLPKKEKFVLYPFTIFCTVTPLFIEYSRTYWNPYFMLPLSLVLLSILVWVWKKKMTGGIAWVLGILFGIGMQLHYSFILTIVISMSLLLMWRRVNLRQSVCIFFGFVLGFLPLIVFELSKNFYNTRTFFQVLQHWETVGGGMGFPYYYLLSLFPFGFFLLSLGLFYLWKRSQMLVMAFLILYCLVCFVFITPVPDHGYGMIPGWNYKNLEKTAALIIAESPSNFNIVDQLTLDNRAMALRYLLTVDGVEPKGIAEYENLDTLYIYSREPVDTLLVDPIYEIKSALPLQHISTREIKEGIFLYRLERKGSEEMHGN